MDPINIKLNAETKSDKTNVLPSGNNHQQELESIFDLVDKSDGKADNMASISELENALMEAGYEIDLGSSESISYSDFINMANEINSKGTSDVKGSNGINGTTGVNDTQNPAVSSSGDRSVIGTYTNSNGFTTELVKGPQYLGVWQSNSPYGPETFSIDELFAYPKQLQLKNNQYILPDRVWDKQKELTKEKNALLRNYKSTAYPTQDSDKVSAARQKVEEAKLKYDEALENAQINEEVKQETENLKAEKTEIDASLSEKKSALSSTKSNINNIRGQISQLQSELDSLVWKGRAEFTSQGEWDEYTNEYRTKQAELENQISELEAQEDEQIALMEEQEEEISNLEQQRAEIDSQIQEKLEGLEDNDAAQIVLDALQEYNEAQEELEEALDEAEDEKQDTLSDMEMGIEDYDALIDYLKEEKKRHGYSYDGNGKLIGTAYYSKPDPTTGMRSVQKVGLTSGNSPEAIAAEIRSYFGTEKLGEYWFNYYSQKYKEENEKKDQ